MTATILIVDDDPDILDLISALLGEEGFQTATYSDGLAALQAVRAQRPALAIIDLSLPIMDGQELIERLRQEPGEPVPVIAMSAAIYAPHPDQLQVEPILPSPLIWKSCWRTSTRSFIARASRLSQASKSGPPYSPSGKACSAPIKAHLHPYPVAFYRVHPVLFARGHTKRKLATGPRPAAILSTEARGTGAGGPRRRAFRNCMLGACSPCQLSQPYDR